MQLGDDVLSQRGMQPEDETLSPVMVAFYREVGFLPAGVLNALSRLGWSLDDSTENMSLQTVVENFSLDRVVKGSASLDPDKLMSFQAYWMSQLSAEEKQDGCLTVLKQAGLISDDQSDAAERVAKVIALSADRLRVFGDILSMDEFFVAAADLKYDEKNFSKRIVKPDDAVDLLQELRSKLAEHAEFRADALHDAVQEFVEAKEIKFGQIAPALRIAVTGKAKGADLFPTLELLGKDECLERIDRAVGTAESMKIS